MSTIPRISFVVPLYYCNPVLYIPITRSLGSIDRYWREGCQLFVIDDASPLELPDVWPVTVHIAENCGFTRTVNIGLEAAFRSGSEIVIVMNDDIEMNQECFERIRNLDPTSPTIASPADTASSPDTRFGACFAITRAAYDLLGPLNEEYRNFFSDRDYYDRAIAAEVTITKWSDVVLDHPESSTYKLLDKESLLNEDAKKYYKQ